MSKKEDDSSKYPRVLLVDDNEIDNFINERMILSTKFAGEVIVKNSADTAMSFLKQHEGDETNLPDVIFLDLNMPVKDGFAFLEEYDAVTDTIKNKCKVIVLSSSISPEDINKASTNPYVFKYINKPLSEKYLDAINV
ncbi:MAG: response regulator [Bacteroidia bacterium]|nr:response regulator [Bacteroidia bacterium]NNC86479.1 response regulator [Bacteroidia bacterium]NNM16874.1 response regulator [Bacteroidia bacterium]